MCIEEIESCMLSDLHCSSMEACFWCVVSGWESMMGSRAGVSLRTTALLDACSLWKTGRAETELRSNKHVARMSHNFILDCSFERSCNGAKVKAWTSAQKSMHEWQKTWLWMENQIFHVLIWRMPCLFCIRCYWKSSQRDTVQSEVL